MVVPQSQNPCSTWGQGSASMAADEAQQAIKCDGDNGRAYFVLGSALNAQQKYEDAIRTLNEGIRFQPDAWQPYFELGKSLLGLHRTSEAVLQLKKAESMAHNTFPRVHTVLAAALLQLKDYQNARTQLLIFLKAAPNHPDAEKIKTLLAQIDIRLQSGVQAGK